LKNISLTKYTHVSNSRATIIQFRKKCSYEKIEHVQLAVSDIAIPYSTISYEAELIA